MGNHYFKGFDGALVCGIAVENGDEPGSERTLGIVEAALVGVFFIIDH